MPVVLAAVVAVVLQAAPDQLPPQIVHEPCDEYTKGENFDVWARFYDDSQIFDPQVIYRSSASGGWKHAPFKKEPGKYDFKATIRGKDLKAHSSTSSKCSTKTATVRRATAPWMRR